MQWALGCLGWSPKQFWSATPIELRYAIEGWKIANGADEKASNGNKILSKRDVEELRELMEEDDG